MKKDKVREYTMKEFAEVMGLNYEVLMIKRGLIDAIRDHCKRNKISQRKLAALVPGLSQDRVSVMYNGSGAGITIDKLITVAQALKIKVTLMTTAA